MHLSKNFIKLLSFIALGVFSFTMDDIYSGLLLDKISYTLFAIAAVYFLTHIVAESYMQKTVKEKRTRYSLRRSLFFVHLAVLMVVIITIWIENVQTLLVAYGIVGAGAAVALQDFFKNLMGGIILFTKKPYTIGDRIEIDSKHGDVMDIGLLYTSIVEMREWVGGDQATGRLTKIPNSRLMTGAINNYTQDYNFIWDEISIPITYGDDWQKARAIIKEVVDAETEQYQQNAKNYLELIREKYYIQERDTEPSIFMNLTDNWINFTVRYVCPVYERRIVAHTISQRLMETIEKEKDINIASSTLVVYDGEN